MTVARVNLLPPEIGQRSARRRVIAIASGLLALYAVLLVVLYVIKAGEVAEAVRGRDEAQAQLVVLQGRQAELAPFGALDSQLAARNAVLVTAMTPEVSGARLLNELSLEFPANSALRGLTLAIEAPIAAPPAAVPADAASVPVEPGAVPVTPEAVAPPAPLLPDATLAGETVIGGVTYDGYTVEQYAPGVETLLVDLARVPGFANPFALTAAIELIGETPVTSFGGTAQLTAEAYTRRYERGLTLETLR